MNTQQAIDKLHLIQDELDELSAAWTCSATAKKIIDGLRYDANAVLQLAVRQREYEHQMTERKLQEIRA
jgi:hypothetical protein